MIRNFESTLRDRNRLKVRIHFSHRTNAPQSFRNVQNNNLRIQSRVCECRFRNLFVLVLIHKQVVSLRYLNGTCIALITHVRFYSHKTCCQCLRCAYFIFFWILQTVDVSQLWFMFWVVRAIGKWAFVSFFSFFLVRCVFSVW